MKLVFLVAILLGFGGTLAGAHFAPWREHARLPSHTTVVANGGRAEQFLIRLPADRIAASDAEAGGLRARGDGAMALPAQLVTAAGGAQSRTVTIVPGASISPATVAAGGIEFDPLAGGQTTVVATIPGIAPTDAASVTVTVGGG